MVAAIDHKKINIATGEFKKGTWGIGSSGCWVRPSLLPTSKRKFFSFGGTIRIIGSVIMIVQDRISGHLTKYIGKFLLTTVSNMVLQLYRRIGGIGIMGIAHSKV